MAKTKGVETNLKGKILRIFIDTQKLALLNSRDRGRFPESLFDTSEFIYIKIVQNLDY